MFKAASLVLALVLCVTGWPTAHAGPLFESLAKTATGGYVVKNGAVHLKEPFKAKLPFNGEYEKDKLNLPTVRDIIAGVRDIAVAVGFTSLASYLTWEHWTSSPDNSKDAARDRAFWSTCSATPTGSETAADRNSC